MKKAVVVGIISGILFLLFSFMIRSTAVIWFQIRVFGLLAYFSFFSTLLLGELRQIYVNKADFAIFRFHKPLAIFSIALLTIHAASAILDNYARGKLLGLASYLGFSFGDRWLAALSLGVLAFYLFILIGMTSRTMSIQKLGFKNWRKIHNLTYVAFILAYVHAVNIGTDVRGGVLSVGILPLMHVTFFTVVALRASRLLAGLLKISNQGDMVLAIVVVVLFLATIAHSLLVLGEQGKLVSERQQAIDEESDIVLQLEEFNSRILQEITSTAGDEFG